MTSDADWPASMESLIWFRILRRKTAISVLWNYPHCTDFTVRITAAVSIHGLKRKIAAAGIMPALFSDPEIVKKLLRIFRLT